MCFAVSRDGGICLWERGCEGRGRQAAGQEAGDAVVARIVHVELIVRDDVLRPVLAARDPMPHHGKAPEHGDFQIVTHLTDAIHNGFMQRTSKYARGVLRVHQDNVYVGRLESRDARADGLHSLAYPRSGVRGYCRSAR